MVFNKTGNQIFGRLNGTTRTSVHSYNNSLYQNADYRLFRNRGGTKPAGILAEHFFKAGIPGTGGTDITDVEKAEGYLAHKWGLESSLPSNHPYKSSAPVTQQVKTYSSTIYLDPDHIPSGNYTIAFDHSDFVDENGNQANLPSGYDSFNIQITNNPDVTPPSVLISDTDDDNLLDASDTVTLTAYFSEAMTATPTISISSGVLSNPFTTKREGVFQIGQSINGQANDWFGFYSQVSEDGKTIVTGGMRSGGTGNGYAKVFRWNGTEWLQLGNTITGSTGEGYGRTVAISGNGQVITVGGGGSNYTGKYGVYTLVNNTWTLRGGSFILGEAAQDLYQSGSSIHMSYNGDVVAIGAPRNDGVAGSNTGHVRVYHWDGSSLSQRGSDIEGDSVGGQLGGGSSGVSLSSDGNRMAIGAYAYGTNEGKVRVYDWDGSNWNLVGGDIDDTYSTGTSNFGVSVSLSGDGNTLVAGGWTGQSKGIVNIYEYEVLSGVETWTLKRSLEGSNNGDNFGYSSAINSIGDKIVVGAYGYSSNRGYVRVYNWDGTNATQISSDVIGDNGGGVFGVHVDISSNGIFTVGAPYDSGGGTQAGLVKVFGINPYQFVWDVDNGNNTAPSDGIYYSTVSGADLVGNSYAGTDSITFTLDSSTPTVTLTTNDPDNTIKPGDPITITATFSEPMASGPSITIGSAVSNAALTATSSTTFTYSWSTSGVSAGSYTVTVTGTDLAGNTYAGSDSIEITLDATAPTVTLSDTDDDNLLAASDTVTITASFNEGMTATPTISITGVVTNVTMSGGGTASFTASDIATSADAAHSVFAADMDGDGDMDIISASLLDNTIAWYENNGAADPSWTASDIATSAAGAISVFAADMDGDGDMDIISASYNDDTIAWYENNGAADPSWTASDIATSADGARSVFAADLDGDGDMDIVSASVNDDTIAWYKNNGAADPSFTAADIATNADGAYSVFAADMDGDGDMDIVSASYNDDTIAWYENNGASNPSWTKAVIATSADGPWSVYAADMDGDGDMDIVSASSYDDTIAWYENNGASDPSWTAADIATSAESATSVYVADIDGDGDMDIISSSQSDNTIAWYENNGASDPSFTAADIATDKDGAMSVFAADMDGDGDMDIVSASANDDTIAWYENTGFSYSYSWDVDSGGAPSDGTYAVTVAGADKAGNAYSGTDSITFTLDTSAPTVTLTDTDSDNLVSTSEVVTITAGFSKTMTPTPTISITGIVTNVIMELVDYTVTDPVVFNVTVANSGGNKYFIDGQSQLSLNLVPGQTYRFDQSDSSNSGHPIRFSTTSDGTHNSGSAYTTNVSSVGTPGQSGAYTLITIPSNGPSNLYYYCANHPSMGGDITKGIGYYYRWDTSSGTLTTGNYAATVSGTDSIGNAYAAGTQSITFTVDTTSPTLTITTPSGPKVSNSSIVVTLTYNEAVTGLTTDTSQFSAATNVASLELLSASSDGKTYTLRINPTGEGLVKLTHAPGSPPVKDLAGNSIASTVSCSFTYDTSGPTVTFSDTDDDNLLAASDTVTITASFNEGMTATPTISISGTSISGQRMTKISGGASGTGSATQIGGDIDGEAAGDASGDSVSFSSDGSRVAIGAILNDGGGNNTGHVRIYQYNNNSWSQLGADINGEAANDTSGYSVSLSSDGSRVAIGAYNNDAGGSNSGHVRIYDYNGSAWVQVGADINGEAANDRSGRSVSLSSDGSRVAIGAEGNNGGGTDSGHVRIYDYNGSAWEQVGADINGEATDDRSGYSVSLSSDGSIVAVGAYNNDGGGSNSGHVRIYQYNNNSWSQLGSDIDGEAANDNSGYSVSLSSDGSRVAIGALSNDGGGNNSGHVRIYQYNNNSWSQLGADIDGEAAGDSSHIVSLSSDGSRVAIGAEGNNGGGTDSGHVRIYDYNGSAWVQVVVDIDGEAADDRSGLVSLSSDGSRVAIGAPFNDGNGTSSGHVRIYSLPRGESYQYAWDVDSGGAPSDGTYRATVAGS